MRTLYLNFIIGLGIGTFFGTEVFNHLKYVVSDKAMANPAVVDSTLSRDINRGPTASSDNKKQILSKDQILKDPQNKISEDFKIPDELEKRVGFWFDVYTKYSSKEHVIHHADYPWIVFKVIDLHPILDAKGNRWTKHHKSLRFAKKEKREVRNILKKLSKRKNFKKLSKAEREIYNQLLKIPGKRKKVISQALKSVRTQVGQKDFIETGLKASSLYLPELERIFTEQGLPVELTRLPFVESSFNVDAVSKVGASGIWQVMPYIGKKFLIMNRAIDERNSPIKAASSAAFILKQNKKILKNWPLALTAYNHGVGNLNKAVKKTGSRDLKYLIKNYHSRSFGFASQNFFASFLAVLHAEKYKKNVYDLSSPHSPLKFRELKLTRSVRLKTLLRYTGMSKEGFQKYNLDVKSDAFRKNMLIPKGYVVHIPSTIITEFLAKKQKFGKLINKPANSTL